MSIPAERIVRELGFAIVLLVLPSEIATLSAQPTLSITVPSNGAVVAPGQHMTVNVQASGGTSLEVTTTALYRSLASSPASAGRLFSRFVTHRVLRASAVLTPTNSIRRSPVLAQPMSRPR